MSEICSEDRNVEPYVEGELSDEQKREFEQHLTECDECREQVEMARKLESAMQRVAAKMEKLHQKMEEKVASIEQKISHKMEEVSERLDRKTESIDERMAAKMEKLRRKMEARGARVDENDSEDMDEFGREMEAFGREMDAFGREMDAFGREMDGYGREMDEFGREMEEFAREMEAEAPRWLAHSVMEKVRHDVVAAERTAIAKPERWPNWLMWIGSLLFGVGAVALCVLLIFSGVGGTIGDAIASVSAQMGNGILGNQTLLIGLALAPFGYGLFRVGQAMGYL